MRDYIYPSGQSWAGHLAIYQYCSVMATDTFDATQPLGSMTILVLSHHYTSIKLNGVDQRRVCNVSVDLIRVTMKHIATL